MSIPAVLDRTREPGLEAPAAGYGSLLGIYAASRLVLLGVSFIVATARGLSVTQFLMQWDANWYLEVVRHGYPAGVPEAGGRAVESTIAFFPLYPLCVRGADLLLPFSLPVVAITVSLVFGAVSVVLLHMLACAVTDRETARRATVLFCVFPGSFVLSMAYSEGLMLVLGLGCLLMLLRGRWLAAGLLAALATACRPTGFALVAACAWQAGLAIHQRREWRALVAPLLAPAGLLAFFVFLWLRTGEALSWFRVEQEGWHHRTGFPPTLTIIGRFLRSPLDGGLVALVAATAIFSAVALVLLLQRRWPGVLAVYTISIVGFAAVSRIDGLRPRDVLTAAPLLIAVGAATRGRLFRAISIGFAGALVVSLVAHNLAWWGQP